MANDMVNGDDLASMSQGMISPLADAGYDADELASDPMKREEALTAIRSGNMGGVGPGQRNAPQPSAAPAPQPQQMAQAAPQAPQASSGLGSAQASPAGGGGTSDVAATGAEALRRSLSLGNLAADTSSALANSPGPDNTALEADEAAHAQKTPYRDPKTGAILPSAQQYAPTGWQRFGRGAKGVVEGLLTGGIPGAIYGGINPGSMPGNKNYGDPNRAYDVAEQSRQSTEASDQQQIQQRVADFKAQMEARKSGASEARAGATAYNDTARGAAGLLNAGTDARKEDQLEATAKDNTPEGATALSQAKFDQLNKQADAMGLRGEQRTLYIANGGKIPDPRQATEGEITRAQAFRVFRKANGREPSTLQELNDVNLAASGKLTGGAGGAPSQVGVQGEDYLKTLPAGRASVIRAIGQGRAMPPSASNRSAASQQLLQDLNTAYPAYDVTKAPAYAALRRNMESGTASVGINSFTTALNHLDRLEKNIPDNTGFSFLNKAESAMSPSGSARSRQLAKFDDDVTAVSGEIAKAYKGGVISQPEHDHMMKLINRDDDPETIKSHIQEFKELLKGKLDAYQRQWKQAAPAGVPSPLDEMGYGGGAGASQSKTGGAAASSDNWFAQHPVAQ